MENSQPVIVVGAGIMGLSVIYELSIRGIWCILVEERERFGEGASSRNSEVMHGGFLSEPESLRQKMCVAGGEELRRRIEEWGLVGIDAGNLSLLLMKKRSLG